MSILAGTEKCMPESLIGGLSSDEEQLAAVRGRNTVRIAPIRYFQLFSYFFNVSFRLIRSIIEAGWLVGVKSLNSVLFLAF